MEIRMLRYFLAVAREENMTRAAELLHVTQPTLSRTMRALEDELGKKLFTRHSFHISLTEEGVLLRDRAEDLVTMADKIEKEFLSLDDITGGDLYFGLAESYQIRYLARELRVLKAQYPGLKYHITSGDTEQVTEKLDKGLLDFAVICDVPNGKKYDAIVFPEGDTWGLVLPAEDPLPPRLFGTLRADPLRLPPPEPRTFPADGRSRVFRDGRLTPVRILLWILFFVFLHKNNSGKNKLFCLYFCIARSKPCE